MCVAVKRKQRPHAAGPRAWHQATAARSGGPYDPGVVKCVRRSSSDSCARRVETAEHTSKPESGAAAASSSLRSTPAATSGVPMNSSFRRAPAAAAGSASAEPSAAAAAVWLRLLLP